MFQEEMFNLSPVGTGTLRGQYDPKELTDWSSLLSRIPSPATKKINQMQLFHYGEVISMLTHKVTAYTCLIQHIKNPSKKNLRKSN